jgi:hypothetical protein
VPSLRSPWRAAADAPLHEVADDAAVGVLVVDVPEAETPTQTSSDLRLRASYFYPDRAFPDIVRKAIRQAYTRAGLPHARAYRPAKSPAPRSPPRSFSNPNARAWPSVWRSWRRHRDRGSGGREVVVIAQRSRNRAVTDKDQKTRWGKRIAQRYLGANALGSSSLPAPGQAASASRFRPFAAFAGAGGPRAAGAGRVRMWRGGLRCGLSVSAPFVWRCLTSRTITPFPHPPHRTGQAELPHPALGQDACLRPRKVSCRPPHHRRGPCYPPRLTTSGRVAANRWCRRLGEPPLPGLKSEFSLRFSMWCLPQLPHTTGVS